MSTVSAYANDENANYSNLKSFQEDNKRITLNSNLKYIPETEEMVEAKAINGVPITITAQLDGTGVKVKVGNAGVDPLDSVTVRVTATGYSSAKTQTSSVPPIIGKTFIFSFPMIKCNTVYNATITIKDGTDTETKTGQASLTYSETYLSGKWHKGTFSSRVASFEYHFNKHKSEVKSTNLVDYLNKAMSFRSQVLSSTANITVVNQTTPTPAKKYTHRIKGTFIILANSDQTILSFGGGW